MKALAIVFLCHIEPLHYMKHFFKMTIRLRNMRHGYLFTHWKIEFVQDTVQ
ncbi:MAG: hypothetical protein K0S60_41 [Evtepia sp.]|jgi:hypothetical protein|nr:hypothetical protein [Evtepia sp.]